MAILAMPAVFKLQLRGIALDHVLHNKLNCTDAEKENNAFAFARQYKNDVPGFVSYIADSDFAVPGTYLETWNFIKQDKHSLERYTNLGICLHAANKTNEENEECAVKQ